MKRRRKHRKIRKLRQIGFCRELMRELNNAGKSAADSPVSAENLAELIKILDTGKDQAIIRQKKF